MFCKSSITGCVALMAVFAVAGCKEVLYSDLQELEANEMVAVLAAAGVDSGRSRDKDGIYALSVEEADVAEAIVVLRARGYPKEKFQSLGDIFSADGIIGTPFEQHARFIHAMNQELSHSLTSISGIRSAQVLTTAPVPGRYEREAPPATASVTLHYEPDFNPEENVSKIKRIVSSAVPNLEYDDVTVAAFPANGAVVDALPLAGVAAPATTASLPAADAGTGLFAVDTRARAMRLLGLGALAVALLWLLATSGRFWTRGKAK